VRVTGEVGCVMGLAHKHQGWVWHCYPGWLGVGVVLPRFVSPPCASKQTIAVIQALDLPIKQCSPCIVQ
jgi:hypothetical protein